MNILGLLLVVLLLAATVGDRSVMAASWDTFSDTWVATDALGREVPDYEECGPPREDKYVGIFYFLWLGPHGYDHSTPVLPDQGVQPKTGMEYKSPYDITRILAGEQEWGPWHAFHHWGRPLFGYYLSDDEWVIRKHAQMLTDAGVDVIICDVTNGRKKVAQHRSLRFWPTLGLLRSCRSFTTSSILKGSIPIYGSAGRGGRSFWHPPRN
ncbi:MAG: hypothetical protein ACUVX8_09430 [Candidatus Zipacnadales bacterium]